MFVADVVFDDVLGGRNAWDCLDRPKTM